MSSDAFYWWGQDTGAHYGRGGLDHGNDNGAEAFAAALSKQFHAMVSGRPFRTK